MKYPEWLEGFGSRLSFEEVLNIGWYQWKRVSWTISPWAWWCDPEKVDIDRPIFFLGNQGAGLSLISRIIRRKRGVVSVTGCHEYWSGADEMQRVMAARLPQSLRLSGNVLRGEPPHQHYSPPRGWTYASDDLYDAYYMTEDDYTPGQARALRSVIAESIYRFSSGEEAIRFVDKSQVFTLKIRLIDSLLRETNPHFVLITRNPYAACYRAAKGRALDMKRYSEFMSFHERLDVCAEHWANAIGTALEDGEEVENFLAIRFEDFLSNPESCIRRMCRFLGIKFSAGMMPSPNDTIPLGTRFEGRWYPIRENVNDKYLESIKDSHFEVIESHVSDVSDKLRYEVKNIDK